MCREMAAGHQIQEELPEKQLRKQLAATVRNIQWSYAVFWSLSTRQQGVLTWGDGYYNGEIKTRKTTQPMEFKADQIGLQRSEQLRELYGSLSGGDCNQQTRRPSASLSPEDLTAAEWYYLVCMSFSFGSGQGLPGRALASNRHIWLSNAPFADSKTFSRSLLAKSASIQTVVCFPFMGGVLELGTTELVLEDPSLIQQVTTSFWELPIPVYSEQSISSTPMAGKDEDNIQQLLDHELEEAMDLENRNLVPECQTPLEDDPPPFPFTLPSYDKVEELNPNIGGEVKVVSPDDSSNDYFPNNQTDDSIRREGLNATSQVQSHRLMDDEFSNCAHGSLNSSDRISRTFVNPQRILSSPKGGRINNHVLDYLQEGNHTKLVSLGLDGDETHYTRTLAAILRNSKGLTSVSCFPSSSSESSFVTWRRGLSTTKPFCGTPQKLLKKILIDHSWIHGGRPSEPLEENGSKNRVCKLEGDDAGANHVLSERRRREKLNEKFLVLRSLVPSISKVDKASILSDTIEYLKELERRVEELESCREVVELEARGRRKHPDIAERTSDNYGNNESITGRKSLANKRKASDIDETDAEQNHWVLSKDGVVDINVTVVEKEVMIEMQCPWRECLLLEIVEAITNLHLDAHSVQSSTVDNILALTIKAKFRDLMVVSPGTIKRTLQRVVGKY